MNDLLTMNLLAAVENAHSYTATEFDWPETPLSKLLFFGGFALLLIYAIWMYIRDTRAINGFWRALLLLLRLSVIAGLALIVLNPQERTQRMSYRPSRVAVLVDTSLSMKFPNSMSEDGSTARLSRAGAIEHRVV